VDTRISNFVAGQVTWTLRKIALACKLLSNKELEEESKINDWRLGEVITFFSTESQCKNVQSLDRLMVLMRLLAMPNQEEKNILINLTKSHKKD
jgi:hypothetical protein